MPELPEVETIVRDLNKTGAHKLLCARFINVWTNFPKTIKEPESFEQFKNKIKGKEIQKIWRRGKNIIFSLSESYFLLIHQKLTGHLLFGRWEFREGEWVAPAGPLAEKVNSYIHLLFTLDSGQMLALSDLRKFAKVKLLDNEKLKKEISFLGPEPLEKDFTFEKFRRSLEKRKGKIKQVLMNQEIIAGIGNIYSDEILWRAKVHPFKDVSKLTRKELENIYKSMREILAKAIKLGGESISDFRKISGKKGHFDKERKVYQREGEKCSRCGEIIKRVKLAGRSAHFCPKCQKL